MLYVCKFSINSWLLFFVSDASGIPSAAVLSTAARLLLPVISAQDVNMIIERELMKTNESTSVAAKATSIGNSKVSASSVNDGVSAALKSVTDECQQSVAVSGRVVDQVLVSDSCDGKNSWSVPGNLQTKHGEKFSTERQSYVGEEQQLCSKLDPTMNIKKSDDGDDVSAQGDVRPSVHFMASSSLLAGGSTEILMKSAATLAGLCKNRLSSDEINNNCRRGCVSSEKLSGNTAAGRDAAAVRKSQRCNRGRRYNELMSQHRTSRKRSESLTL